MPEPKEITDHYLERYRKTIRFANIALVIALAILVVNWLFAVEPGYQNIQYTNKAYKSQLKATREKASYYDRHYSFYDNLYYNDSVNNLKNIKLAAALKKQQEKAPNDKILKASIDDLEREIELYLEDSAFYAGILTQKKLYQDSIRRVKERRKDLNSLKEASLNENLKNYDWQSLVRFVFIVAGNPKSGSLYLMGLITFMIIFAAAMRWICLHYISRSIRMKKAIPDSGIKSFNHLAISAPFWLAPLPNDSLSVQKEELAKVLGFFSYKNKLSFFATTLLILLLILEIRLFYICIYSNLPDRFNFIFTIGVVFFLISLILAILWLIPIKIDDHFDDELAESSVSRRLFIGLGAATLLGAGLLLTRKIIAGAYGLDARRFVRRKRKSNLKIFTDLQEGLYFRRPHPKNRDQVKYLHFFNENHYSITMTDIRNETDLDNFKKNLVRITGAENLSDPSFSFRYKRRSWHIEHYTMYLLKGSDKKAAVKFIVDVIKKDGIHDSEYRIMDLAAVLCLRYGSPTDLQALIDHFAPPKVDKQENEDEDEDEDRGYYFVPNDNKELDRRVSRWRSREWAKKFRAKKTINWNGVKI